MELRRTTVCGHCLALLRRPKRVCIAATIQATGYAANALPPPTRRSRALLSPLRIQPARYYASKAAARPSSPSPAVDLDATHRRVQELSATILKHDGGKIPSEQRVLYVLEQLESIGKLLLVERGSNSVLKPKITSTQQETAASALLGSVNSRQYPASISKAALLAMVSESAEAMVRHPHVFLTPEILKAYVELQSLLQQPTSIPDIFNLYATKPIPQVKNQAVQLLPTSPTKINAAIDSKTARLALTAATKARDLTLAIDVINTSFCTPAFKKAKILRRASVPVAGLAVAPAAAYTLSNSFSSLQQTMDPATATGIAFAGIMTYVGAVSMVGYVAVTTANDQMDRVTWASGVPLWERWIREEERSAADQVAAAWGFRNVEQHGEEEGADWEGLREWLGIRGMVLDRVNLMEGME